MGGERALRVFAMDECRLGLLPIYRKVWALRGSRPRVNVNPRYEWMYVYAAVEPGTGETFSMMWSSVSITAMQHWLDEFSLFLNPDDHVILVMDGAGWHSRTGLAWPDNIQPLFLPPYSPECNPSERLWTILRESVANRVYQTLQDLEHAVELALQTWPARTRELSSLTCYGWWAEAVNSVQS